MYMSTPYQEGEVITLRRFKFLPRRAQKGPVILLQQRSEIVSIRVTGHWKLQSGVDQYVGVPAKATGNLALWLRRKADRLEQRIFFMSSDVFRRVSRGPAEADDYPVLHM